MKKNIFRLSLLLVMLSVSCQIQKPKTEHSLNSWALGGFKRPEHVNPVIEPNTSNTFLDPMSNTRIKWEENDTFNPGAVVKDNKIYALYRAEDRFGKEIGMRTSRLGLADSNDGLHFNRLPEPVFYPGNDSQKEYEWPGGAEDPRLAVTEDGTYVVIYTQWNRKVPRLGIATSKDLINWEKHGPIFKNARYKKIMDVGHKSASILTTVKDGKLVICKINGKYWMYWGEHAIAGATSDNLIDWEPVLNNKGEIAEFATPREGYFDSALTECGPPAVLTKDGILLLYNGKNNYENGDKRYAAGSYCAGQILFDKNEPSKVLKRMDTPFLRPMADFEKSGQYIDGTVFIQGLVYFKSRWYLYYGCADSKVGVAIYDPKNPSPFDPLP